VRHLFVCVLMLAAAGLVQEACGQGQPDPQRGDTEQPAQQLSRQQTVAPTRPESSDEARKRAQARRGLIALVLLTLILIAFMLILMVLTARFTRHRRPARRRPKPTSLEDVWWTVKEETIPDVDDVDIEQMMSDDSDSEKEGPQGGEPQSD